MASEDDNQAELTAELRHKAAHDLMSPARAVSIASDMLTDVLSETDPDLDLIRTLAEQLSNSSVDLLQRIRDFADGIDG